MWYLVRGKRRILLCAIVVVSLMIFIQVPTGSAATTTVHMDDNMFSPAQVSIEPGDTVKWVNDESVVHKIVIQEVSAGESNDLHLNENWSHTFDTNGTYKYRCIYHSSNFDSGMAGTVIVGDGGQVTNGDNVRTPGFDVLIIIGAFVTVVIAITYLRARKA